MLTNDEICFAVENAFLPFRCVPEIWDYGQKLRFKVFDAADQPIVTMSEIILSSIRDAAALNSLCELVRQCVQEHVDRSKK
jgi:hypothetical protein